MLAPQGGDTPSTRRMSEEVVFVNRKVDQAQLVLLARSREPSCALAKPVGLSFEHEHVVVVREAIEQRGGQRCVAEHLGPAAGLEGVNDCAIEHKCRQPVAPRCYGSEAEGRVHQLDAATAESDAELPQ